MAVLTRRLARGCAALLLLAFGPASAAPDGALPVWELESDTNRVLIMGSVHFLRPGDYPLRDGMRAAVETADVLVMELDLDEMDPLAAQEAVTRLGIDPDGRNLEALIGPGNYREASARAAELGIPMLMFDQFEPWFAALSITQLRMVQLGFDPAWGVENRLATQAAAAGKDVLGLETLEEQLGFMDSLDPATQSRFLLQSLEDAATVQDEVEGIVRAWRNGDAAALETALLDSLEDAPALYDALLVQRNRNWVAPIRALLDEAEDYLVVVGAMHLVGDDSVLAMLADAGVASRQLTDADFD